MYYPYSRGKQIAESLNKFGKLIVEIFKDKQLEFLQGLLQSHDGPPEYSVLKSNLSGLTSEDKDLILAHVTNAIINGLHDWFLELEYSFMDKGGISFIVDGVDITSKSDGLNAEILGENGWERRFSKFPMLDDLEKKYDL